MCIANVPVEVVFSEESLYSVAAAMMRAEESSHWSQKMGIVTCEPVAIEIFSECKSFGMILTTCKLAFVRSKVSFPVFTI